jgi:hypothetical protein
MLGSIRSISQPPKIQFDTTKNCWNFEPLIVWLKDEQVFDSFNASHPLGPNQNNLDMVDKINMAQPYIHGREVEIIKLPVSYGDGIILNNPSKQISTARIVNTQSSDQLRRLIFSSYAGMLEKIFNPTNIKPFIEHFCNTLDVAEIISCMKNYKGVLCLEGTHLESGRPFDLQSKRQPPGIHRREVEDIKSNLTKNPTISLAVMAYYKAIRDYTYQLQEAIRNSASLNPEQKENGIALCDSIISNGVAANSPVVSKINASVGLAYTVRGINNNGDKPEVIQEDFLQGMEFLRNQEFFKNGNSRCPGEATILKLSAILTGSNDIGGNAFGSTLHAMHKQVQRQLANGSAAMKNASETIAQLMKMNAMGGPP